MATPSKGIIRPVTTFEVAHFKRLAREGHSVREIMRMTGRSKFLVQKHVKGLTVHPGPGARMLSVLAIAEASKRPLGVLACDLGYANGGSLASVLSVAKRLRAWKSGERARWR